MHDQQAEAAREFRAFEASSAPLRIAGDRAEFSVGGAGLPPATFALSSDGSALRRLELPNADPEAAARSVLAALEAAFAWEPDRETRTLDLAGRDDVLDRLAKRGVVERSDGAVVVEAAMLMQQADVWLAKGATPPYPERFVLSEGRRHPLRGPKPEGVVYARYIPWLGQTLTFRALRIEDDLEIFHRWMNDEQVAAFWAETGDLAAHRGYLERLIADPHMIPMIGAFDGEPFAYFEIYWAKENRLAPFYDADDYDRGWHVAVGERNRRGGAYISAWLPSLVHFMLLDDPRTRRIVGEPATAHRQQIRNLERSGFAQIKSFDFPHKRATLVSLSRERFFAERVWLPAARRGDEAGSQTVPTMLAGAA